LTLIVTAVVFVIAIPGFITIMLKCRRGLGGLTHIIYGATDEFYTTDKKRAIEVVAEQKACKKMEEQESGQTMK